jgi:FkbM family methyltransferase
VNFVSFAQNFEDVVLWRVLNDVGQGRYLDIGAQDPIVDSVSYGFYKAGWRGIHVEPTPFYAARLRECRPDELVIEAAVTEADGPITFYEIPATGLSTGKREIAEGHDAAGYPQRELIVPCVRLDKLLEATDGELHWMKVDVEGMEADVLRSWGTSEFRPWVLVIESTYPNSQKPTQGEWLEGVLGRGYREVLFDGLSRYFLHEAHADRKHLFGSPANIFDNFVVARDHFTARLIRDDADQAERRAEEEQALARELESKLDQVQAEALSAQSLISDLQRTVSETEKTLASARAKEASVLLNLARREREHQAILETSRIDHLTAETELRRAFVQKCAALRRDLRQSRSAESLTRKQLEQSKQNLNAGERRHQQQVCELQGNVHRLNQELEIQREAAVRADALIRKAARSKPTRWQLIGQALGLVDPPKPWRDLSSWPLSTERKDVSPTPQVSDEGLLERMPGNPVVNEQSNPYLRANSLPQLLNWEDQDFVRCAFVTVLGRQPDAAGENYYLDRIRNGHSKLEVLWQLRQSAEGRRHDPGIAGFDRALKRAAWSRKRLIGMPMRAIMGGEVDDRIERMRRSLKNELRIIRKHVETRPANGLVTAERHNGEVAAQRDVLREQQELSPLAFRALDIMTGAASR